ncbi:MAG: hypothetical protein CL910_10220 [Deltaproteobacteria bacterium]|jgi:hypothetical protein|nr:hypothetical protein [Deltaproteobacteria bacterium]
MASETSDPRDDDPDDESQSESAGFFPELLRRGLSMGFTGFFMTEEAIRRAFGDSAPREVIDFVLEQSEKTRTEFLDRMSREFGRTLQALDPVELARRLLDGRTIEVSAQVRFVADEREDEEGGPSVSRRVSFSSSGGGRSEEREPE